MYVKVESASDTGEVAIRHPASSRGCLTDLNLCHHQNSSIHFTQRISFGSCLDQHEPYICRLPESRESIPQATLEHGYPINQLNTNRGSRHDLRSGISDNRCLSEDCIAAQAQLFPPGHVLIDIVDSTQIVPLASSETANSPSRDRDAAMQRCMCIRLLPPHRV